jgi:HK97 family phage prohead protease
MNRTLEKRSFKAIIRTEQRGDAAAGAGRIVGYAAVYNEPSHPLPDERGGAFVERIAPGAFRRALAASPDVRLLVNHDPNLLLARTKNGTLRLNEDARRLKIDADPADTQTARDALALLRRGDMDQMSFGFYVVRDEWNAERTQRMIHDLELDDVSIVTYPAYEATTAAARGAPGVETMLTRMRILDAELAGVELGC